MATENPTVAVEKQGAMEAVGDIVEEGMIERLENLANLKVGEEYESDFKTLMGLPGLLDRMEDVSLVPLGADDQIIEFVESVRALAEKMNVEGVSDGDIAQLRAELKMVYETHLKKIVKV